LKTRETLRFAAAEPFVTDIGLSIECQDCGAKGPLGIQSCGFFRIVDKAVFAPWPLAATKPNGYPAPMAKLYFHYSTMNAGKSTLLLQASYNYRERGMETYLLTAAHDKRAGSGKVASRIGIDSSADTFDADSHMFEMIERRLKKSPVACIFVDEAQFLTKEQVWQLARAVDDLGVPIMCYGLRVDFRGELFPGSATLLALSDEM
jgi:thymidine kinase